MFLRYDFKVLRLSKKQILEFHWFPCSSLILLLLVLFFFHWVKRFLIILTRILRFQLGPLKSCRDSMFKHDSCFSYFPPKAHFPLQKRKLFHTLITIPETQFTGCMKEGVGDVKTIWLQIRR